MKYIQSIIIASFLAVSLSSWALTVNNTAGSLSTNVTDLSVRELTINGTINAADFDFISNKLVDLTTLNIKNTSITAYTGDRVLAGITESDANKLPDHSLMGTKISSLTLPDNLTVIGEGALAATPLSSITLPMTLTTIESSAFASTNLTSVNIPSTASNLGTGIFKDCTSLTNADIHALITTVGDNMFAGCVNLANLYLPTTIKVIGDEAYLNCKKLKSYSFGNALEKIGNEAFYGSGLTAVSFQQSPNLSEIGNFAFAKCADLKTLNLSVNDIELGEGVFFDDSSLKDIIFNDGTKTIPSFTFKGATSLDDNVSLPSELEEIKDYALTGWSNIKNFNLPSGITRIGDNAMEGWTSIDTIHGETLAAIPELGDNVWKNVDQANVSLIVKDDNTAKEYAATPQWNEFNIIAQSTTGMVDGVIDTDKGSNVEFSFEGNTLVVKSKDVDIAEVNIYDLDGKRRYVKPSSGREVRIDMSAWSRMMIIAEARLANNNQAAIKINR